MPKRTNVEVAGDLMIQKPMYFTVSQLRRIDEACSKDEIKSRADFVRTGMNFFLNMREFFSSKKSDEEILIMVKNFMNDYFNN